MTGSYLFNYESYYNGLMADWGLQHRRKRTLQRYKKTHINQHISSFLLLLTMLC